MWIPLKKVAKVDLIGRFYGGTMRTQLCTHSSAPNGSLYYYTSYVFVWRVCENSRHIDGCDLAIHSIGWSCLSGNTSIFLRK